MCRLLVREIVFLNVIVIDVYEPAVTLELVMVLIRSRGAKNILF
jgi:hypothetical protein